MKKLNHLLLLLTVIAFFAASCGKDGAVGPQGSAGAAGAQGAVGAAGADGTKIYSGTTAPATTVGNNGDFYLNVATSDLYGPKTATGWGAATNLKGATGATGAAGAAGTNGTNGSKIYSGSGVPASSIGVDGDYYLDITGYLFYGPKTSGAWPAPINLKGPQGPPGTANVIYSDWYTPSSFSKTTVFGTFHFSASIPAPSITQDVIDKGTVIVYGKLAGYNALIWPAGQISAMPIVINYLQSNTPQVDTWSALVSLGNLQIDMTNDNNIYSSISNTHSFRYIIIPGAVHTINVANFRNYNQVKQAFHLPD